MYQFVFANLFPRYYGKFNSRGVENNIEFTSFYANYLNEANVLDWQKNTFLEQNLPITVNDAESESDVEIVDIKKVKKEEKEEKKQKRIKRKEEMQKQKKILEEKLKENTEKMYKIRKV